MALSGTKWAGAEANTKAAFKDVMAHYRPELDRVETGIREQFQSDVTLIPTISSYLIGGGGKRIRPLLVIISSRLAGYSGNTRHIDLSVVAEYIHAATLLHDDVVDEADMRRGSESANIAFGNEASVLVGDFLFAKSFSLMSRDNDIRIIKTMAGATGKLAEGEILQLVNTCDPSLTEDVYLDTIYRKTAALMEACCRIGAIMGGVNAEQEKALALYGNKIGIAFQLVDDALDYVGEDKEWGKPIGADLAEGKVTLPLIRALALADDEEIERIKSALDNDNPGDLNHIRTIIEKYDGAAYTFDKANGYIYEAKESLKLFEPSPHLDALNTIADYIVERTV